MGCFLLIVFYAILGFGYAWAVGIVAREEISVGQGAAVVFVTSLLGIGATVAIQQFQLGLFLGLPGWFAVHFLGFWLLGMAIAKIPKKESAIVAAIYSVILFGVYLLMTFAMSPAGTVQPG